MLAERPVRVTLLASVTEPVSEPASATATLPAASVFFTEPVKSTVAPNRSIAFVMLASSAYVPVVDTAP